MIRLSTNCESWALKTPFRIARETIDRLPLLRIEIEQDGICGHAEAAGVDYRGETPGGLAQQIRDRLGAAAAFPSREELLAAWPPGGARNALDCALWDVEAKRTGRSVWALAGLAPPRPLVTAYTIGLGPPAEMAAAVASAPRRSPLKLKLGGGDGCDIQRVAAVRERAPSREIIVDVNEGWSLDELNAAAPALAALGVRLIEQPLPAARDAELDRYAGPVPLCADESFDDTASLPRVLGRYAFVNIKLDKCGGLTEALRCVARARAHGLRLLVGSMLGTSLGMAPAFVIGQLCDYVDLDGALLLRADRTAPMRCDDGLLEPFSSTLWG